MRRKTLSVTVGTVAALAVAAAGTLVAWPDEDGDRPVTAAEKRARKADEARKERRAEKAGLTWGECPDALAAPRVRCGTLQVPLDYDAPDGRTIRIALTRMSSSDPDRRRGVPLTGPGGPGSPGRGYPALLAKAGLPGEVTAGYDIIGMDPRGVGASSAVTCDLTRQQLDRGSFPAYATDAAGVEREAAYAKSVAGQCGKSRTKDLLRYLTEANTARDMDRVRAALGEEKISYFGQS